MKGRPFLAVLLMMALLALGLGWGGWWLLWKRGPLQLQHHTLTIPRAARFVPRQAPLSLYIFSDGVQPVDYIRAVAPLRQREAATKAVERLRDGAFAAAGLNYHDELAGWLAPEIGLSLFDAPDGEPGSSWLLVLSSKDREGARRFLQRFWQSRSLAGSGLQISQYRGMGLISGRGALVGRDPAPLATALVQDDLVLIASGRTTLERALDVSQIDALNEAGLTQLKDGVEQLGEGMALIVARSEAFSPWLGLPNIPGSDSGGDPLLVGTLHPNGRQLELHGVLHVNEAPTSFSPESGASARDDLATETLLLRELGGESHSLALLRNPAALLAQPWLKPLVQTITSPPGSGPLPLQLAGVDPEVLLVSQAPEGWVLGTSEQTPRPEALEAALAAEGLIDAPLEVDGETVTVWTRLGARQGTGDQLQALVSGWWRPRDGVAWWGGNLALLHQKSAGRSVVARQQQLEDLDRPQAPLRWVLGEEAATPLLQQWRPWTRLTTVAGGPLAKGLESLALALEPSGGNVRCTARIQFAGPPYG
ncbi:MAG: DUF3352 domain-containing protein [Cyanobacteriota bacterium]|nr:DUF3352 domain-containing protein [Cyanobacteriota bacterium]